MGITGISINNIMAPWFYLRKKIIWTYHLEEEERDDTPGGLRVLKEDGAVTK